MNYSAIFKKKRQDYFAVLIGSITLFMIYFFVWYETGFGILLFLGGTAAIIIYINIYRFNNWRCPDCKAFLGNSIYVETCPSCKCSFTEEKPVLKAPPVYLKNYGSKPELIETKIKAPEAVKKFENYEILN